MRLGVIFLVAAFATGACGAAPTGTPGRSPAGPDLTASPTIGGTPSDPLTAELEALARQLAPPGAVETDLKETPVVVELHLRTTRPIAELEAFWDQRLHALDLGYGKDHFGPGVTYAAGHAPGSDPRGAGPQLR